MIRKNSCLSAASNSDADSSNVAADPLIDVSGARSSWLTMPRNSARSRSSSCSGVRSCNVTTTETTSPPSVRIGVAFISVVTLRPSGTESTISSARIVLRAAEHLRERDLVERDLASVGEAAGNHLQQLHRRSACRAKPLDDAARLAVKRHRVAGAGFEHRHAHRRGLDQGFQVGTGAPLGAVSARVGDHGGRLRGE